MRSSRTSADALFGECVTVETFDTCSITVVTFAVVVVMALIVVRVLTTDARFARSIRAVVLTLRNYRTALAT